MELPDSKTILVMDDQDIIRDLISKMLGYLGFATVCCTDGAEAVELYKKASKFGTPFLAVIMDLVVPGGMGGQFAAEEILLHDPGAKLIVSSGYCDNPVLAEHEAYGFCARLPKPYRFADLREVIAFATR